MVEFRQVLHRDDPERLRRHLHVVVATFDGGWQIGRQTKEMLQRVHSPPWTPLLLRRRLRSTADRMSGLDTMTNLSRPTSRATMAARQLARDDKYQGKGCAWMAWCLVGQAQPPDVGHHVVLRPERGANLWVFFHKPTKLGKGKLHDVVKLMANCLEQKRMRAMSRGNYDGRAAANEPRVLSATGFDELSSLTRPSEATRRPPNTEDEFVHLQSRALLQLRKQLQDDQLQTESLLVSRLLMTDFVINESAVIFRGLRASSRRAKDLDLLRRQRSRPGHSTREASVSAPALYLSVKRKASEQPEKPESEPEVTTFLLPRTAEPRDEDFMRTLPQQQPRSGSL